MYEALLRSDVAERVQLLDFQTDVIALYEKHDVMLLTSSAEGFPMTIRESAAFGMPTVMYDLPCLFLRETDAGIVRVPQMDAAAAAEALLCLAEDNAAFSALSQAALERDVRSRCVDQKQIWKSVFSGNVLQPAKKSNDPAEQMAEEIDDALPLAELSADEARLQMTEPKQTINHGTRYHFKHMVAAALLQCFGREALEKALRCLYRTAESIKSNDKKAEGGCLRLLSMNLRDRVDFDGCGLLSFLPLRRDGADERERLARNPAVVHPSVGIALCPKGIAFVRRKKHP